MVEEVGGCCRQPSRPFICWASNSRGELEVQLWLLGGIDRDRRLAVVRWSSFGQRHLMESPSSDQRLIEVESSNVDTAKMSLEEEVSRQDAGNLAVYTFFSKLGVTHWERTSASCMICGRVQIAGVWYHGCLILWISSGSRSVHAFNQSKLVLTRSLNIQGQVPKHHVLRQYAIAAVVKSAPDAATVFSTS